MFKYKSINQTSKIIMILSGIAIFTVTLLFFLNNYINHINELKRIEKDFIESQKEYVKNETLRALKFINYYHKKYKDKNLSEIQKKIVEVIEHTRDVGNKDGYVFIYTFDGINVADPILNNKGKNLIDFKDTNQKLVIKELIDISKKPNGGYVEYIWNKPTTHKLTKKISYAVSYKPFNWMIGSGVYLDDIKKIIAHKKEQYKAKTIKYIIQITIFAFILFILNLFIQNYFSKIIKKDIDLIRKKLKKVLIGYELIDLNKIKFREFKQISFFINKMIKELKELNTNLENKVQQRTNELQEAQLKALSLVKQQDDFIKNAIHEINTPLSIIITNIDLFKIKHGINRYLTKIEAASKIIHNIYNDLSYFIKKDRIEYKPSKINLSKFLELRIDFFNEVAIGNNLTFEAKITPNLFINFNETLLQRVIDNSISNAVKYSYKNTKIEIVLKKEDSDILLIIKNKGDNIKNIDKIFEKFYRENENRGGFGIGLNMIKDICDKNKIDIKVSSNNNIISFEYYFKGAFINTNSKS